MMDTYKFSDWMIWNGGKCPVEPDTLVQVQKAHDARDEAKRKRVHPASFHDWRWGEDGEGADIVNYRIATRSSLRTLSCSVTIVTKGETYTAYYSPGTVTLIDGKPDWSTLKAEGVE